MVRKVARSSRASLPFAAEEERVKGLCRHSAELREFVRPDGTSVELFVQRWFPASGEVKAVVVHCHGLHDHSGRLAHAAPATEKSMVESFLEDGIGVIGFDLEGHGRSGGKLGLFHDCDHLASDYREVLRSVRKEYPQHKVFMTGGSLGGMLMLRAVLQAQADNEPIADGMVLACPLVGVAEETAPSPAVQRIARAIKRIAPSLPLVRGPKGRCFKPDKDRVMQKATDSDPLFYSGNMRIGTGLAIKAGLDVVVASLSEVALPFVIQHGDNDRVCSLKGSQDLLAAAGSQDKQLKVYQSAEHGLEQEDEPIVAQLRADRLAWIAERL